MLKKPDFSGVHGALVNEGPPPDVLFGPKKLRTSPYDPLLLQLQRAGAGKFLKFDDLRARPSLVARAKRLNIAILFGEQGSTLWVTLAKADLATDGVADVPAAPKARPLPEIVLEGIRDDKRDTPGLIVAFCRKNGAPDVTLNAVDAALAGLLREGKIKLKAPVKGLDGDRWAVR